MRKRSRREFLRALAGLGIGSLGVGGMLSGCGSPGQTPVKEIPAIIPSPTARPPAEPTQAAEEPTPSRAEEAVSPTEEVEPGETSAPEPEPIEPEPPESGPVPDLVVAREGNPADLVLEAISALGGMERFVQPGDDVIVKPNICIVPNSYEQAATTNPQVVATLVSLCLEAGAERVRVMDKGFSGSAATAYERSGIKEAAEAAGAQMELMSQMKYRQMDIPEGRDITQWDVYGDILDADVLIDVPIAKHHGSTRLTLGMKNLMGVIQDRGGFHWNLGQRIADLNTLVRPHLTVVDAVRILTDHGPTGGDPNDVMQLDTIIASPDIVAADAYATTLFDMSPADIDYVRLGAEMGIGRMDLENLTISEITV